MWKWEAEGQAKAVVVFIHSAYEHHRRYPWLIEKLRVSGMHVITGDLPGHGEVSRKKKAHDEGFKEYLKFIRQMMEVAINYNLPIFIMGHGLGASLAMELIQIRKYECAGMVLTSPWLHLTHQPSKFSNALSGISKLTGNLKIQHDIPIKNLSRSYEFYKEQKDDPYYFSGITVGWYKELQQFMKSLWTKRETIPDIPVLLMNGGSDKIVSPAYSKKWLSQQETSEFQYKEWKSCYHDLYQEPEREDIYQYMESFMFNALRNIGYII